MRVGDALLIVAVAAGGLGSCSSDPVLSNLVRSLGGEAPGVDPGEYHRAGQACTACHQAGGRGKGDFSVAGTIFWGKPEDNAVGVEDVEVRLVDADGQTRVAKTNCVGNFFIGRTQVYYGVQPWDPKFPILVTVAKPGGPTRPMSSLINRDGSCAGCHRIPAGLDSVGHVYLSDTNQGAPPPPQCPVSPIVPISGRN